MNTFQALERALAEVHLQDELGDMMFDALMMLGKGFVPDAHDEFMKFQYNLSDIDDPGVCAREYSWSDPEECCTRTARKACSRR